MVRAMVRAMAAAVALIENPHQARQKTVRPVGHRRAGVLPMSVAGVHRIKIRMRFHQFAHLMLREPQRFFKKLAVRLQNELNHAPGVGTTTLGGGSSRAGQLDSKPLALCWPSQKGLLSECPQRHSEITVRPASPNSLPSAS